MVGLMRQNRMSRKRVQSMPSFRVAESAIATSSARNGKVSGRPPA